MIAEEDGSMRRATIIAACFSALLVSVAAAPAFAGYGAVALDESAGRYGFGWNEDTQKRADETALQGCNVDGCKIVFRVPPRRCAALATSEAVKATSQAAKATSEAGKGTSEAGKATSEAAKATSEAGKATSEAGKATSGAGKVAWGGKEAATRDAAKLGAIENCQKNTSGKCVIRGSDCNR
jgi:Domain of unknown function (DUF4189)